MTPKTVFSAIQPSGILHLGNFLGVFGNLKRLQEDNFSLYSIVDLHAMTTQSPGLDSNTEIAYQEWRKLQAIKFVKELVAKYGDDVLKPLSWWFKARSFQKNVEKLQKRRAETWQRNAEEAWARIFPGMPFEEVTIKLECLAGYSIDSMGKLVQLEQEVEGSYNQAKAKCIGDSEVSKGTTSIKENIYTTVAAFLATGVKPEALFVQSHVAAHSELGWILSCYAPLGWLNRMTQFKDKGKGNSSVPAGLLTYPVLMAADILLYNTDLVPVGDDQRQHLEFVRDLAQRFNYCTGTDTFKIPTAVIGSCPRVMSLRDGTMKMSKSSTSSASYISLMDSEADIRKKIGSAKTDSSAIPLYSHELGNRPEAKNLLSIYAALANKSLEDVLRERHGDMWNSFKRDLADAIVETITPIGNEMAHIREHEKDKIDDILNEGAEKAKTLAERKLVSIKKAIK